MDKQERDFVIVDGKKFVLAQDEQSKPGGPEPEIFQRLTEPPRNVSFAARMTLLWCNGLVPQIGWFLVCFILFFAIIAGHAFTEMSDHGELVDGLGFVIFGLNFVTFLLGGTGMILYGFFKGRNTLRLLRDGEVGRARFVGMKETGLRVNNEMMMKLHFTFTASDGQDYDVHVKTLETKKLLDDAVEPLFYDPADPKNAILLDSIPSKIRFDDMERTFNGSATAALLPFFCGPLLVVEIILLIYTFSYGPLISFK